MKVFFCTIIFCLFLLTVNGQTKAISPSATRDQPLFLVDSVKTAIDYCVLSPEMISSIDVYKDSNALKKFGEAGKFGVIFIHTKPAAVMLGVDEILNAYNIHAEDRKLSICINNSLKPASNFILIEKSAIETVEITSAINSPDNTLLV